MFPTSLQVQVQKNLIYYKTFKDSNVGLLPMQYCTTLFTQCYVIVTLTFFKLPSSLALFVTITSSPFLWLQNKFHTPPLPTFYPFPLPDELRNYIILQRAANTGNKRVVRNFEGRGGFWKLGHKSMAVLKVKVKSKH